MIEKLGPTDTCVKRTAITLGEDTQCLIHSLARRARMECRMSEDPVCPMRFEELQVRRGDISVRRATISLKSGKHVAQNMIKTRHIPNLTPADDAASTVTCRSDELDLVDIPMFAVDEKQEFGDERKFDSYFPRRSGE